MTDAASAVSIIPGKCFVAAMAAVALFFVGCTENATDSSTVPEIPGSLVGSWRGECYAFSGNRYETFDFDSLQTGAFQAQFYCNTTVQFISRAYQSWECLGDTLVLHYSDVNRTVIRFRFENCVTLSELILSLEKIVDTGTQWVPYRRIER